MILLSYLGSSQGCQYKGKKIAESRHLQCLPVCSWLLSPGSAFACSVDPFDFVCPNPCAAHVQRIIFLETVAGVPGMVAGMLRHLRSLRAFSRDKGWWVERP